MVSDIPEECLPECISTAKFDTIEFTHTSKFSDVLSRTGEFWLNMAKLGFSHQCKEQKGVQATRIGYSPWRRRRGRHAVGAGYRAAGEGRRPGFPRRYRRGTRTAAHCTSSYNQRMDRPLLTIKGIHVLFGPKHSASVDISDENYRRFLLNKDACQRRRHSGHEITMTETGGSV